MSTSFSNFFRSHRALTRYRLTIQHFSTRRQNDLISYVRQISNGSMEASFHCVPTKDGYELGLVNIKSEVRPTKGPVILQHGILDSCFTWIANPVSISLGCLLAQHGFDVWLGNSRGNMFSKRHKHLNPKSEAFWNFTWHHLGLYDVPAVVNYVSNISNSRVKWIGHSQGTTQMFVAGCLLEQQRKAGDVDFVDAIEKIDVHIALAPAAYLSNQKAVILKALADEKVIKSLHRAAKLFGSSLSSFMLQGSTFNDLTMWSLDAFCGPAKYVRKDLLQSHATRYPAGTSVKSVLHYLQLIARPDSFQTFDSYSGGGGAATYSAVPYDWSSYKIPTVLLHGGNDYLTSVEDVALLARKIPNEALLRCECIEDYAHMDFVWGDNVKERLLPIILKYIDG